MLQKRVQDAALDVRGDVRVVTRPTCHNNSRSPSKKGKLKILFLTTAHNM